MDRRSFLRAAGSAALMAGFPAVSQAKSGSVSLQLVGMRFNQSMLDWLNRSGRTQRVLKTGPRVFDGLAEGDFSPVSRSIDMRVFFWMRSGFGQQAGVVNAVNGGGIAIENVRSFSRTGGRLQVDSTERSVRQDDWQRDFSSLPFAESGSLSGKPQLALRSQLSGMGLAWHLPWSFLDHVAGIMVCPTQRTVWPLRTGGKREGLIIVPQEIARWRSGGYKTPTMGLMDRV